MNWEVNGATGVLERCGVGLVGCWGHAESVQWQAKWSGTMWCGSWLLAVECLGSRSVEMHRVVQWTAGSTCSPCSQLAGAVQRGLVELQASECGLCSRLSKAVQKSLVGLQVVNAAWTSHEIICFQSVLFSFHTNVKYIFEHLYFCACGSGSRLFFQAK